MHHRTRWGMVLYPPTSLGDPKSTTQDSFYIGFDLDNIDEVFNEAKRIALIRSREPRVKPLTEEDVLGS